MSVPRQRPSPVKRGYLNVAFRGHAHMLRTRLAGLLDPWLNRFNEPDRWSTHNTTALHDFFEPR
jgi:hypothetical protein